MRNLTAAAFAATLTLGAICLAACAPEQPPVVDEPVEAVPAEDAPVPCGGENCQER
jgi:hypothetical protein